MTAKNVKLRALSSGALITHSSVMNGAQKRGTSRRVGVQTGSMAPSCLRHQVDLQHRLQPLHRLPCRVLMNAAMQPHSVKIFLLPI